MKEQKTHSTRERATKIGTRAAAATLILTSLYLVSGLDNNSVEAAEGYGKPAPKALSTPDHPILSHKPESKDTKISAGKKSKEIVLTSTPTPITDLDTEPSNHPSGNDRNTEPGNSGTQGKSGSNPDGNGVDKPYSADGQPAGSQGRNDYDGNNGCGNDNDFSDDNNGKCGGNEKKTPTPTKTPIIIVTSTPTLTPTETATRITFTATPTIRPSATPKATITPEIPGKELPSTGEPALLGALAMLGLGAAVAGEVIRKRTQR